MSSRQKTENHENPLRTENHPPLVMRGAVRILLESILVFYPNIGINPVVFIGRCPEEIAINKNIYRQETHDISSNISDSTSVRSGFPVTHKVGNVDVFVSLNFENKLDKAITFITRKSSCNEQ